MATYATSTDFPDHVQSEYLTSPDIAAEADLDFLLVRASEIIDEATLYRSARAYEDEVELDDEDVTVVRVALAKAACEQVEFWLEVGPEHDIAGLRGSLVAGRIQVHPVAGRLGPVPMRTLREAGLIWTGVAIG